MAMTKDQEMAVKLERLRKMLDRLSLDAVYLKRQDNFGWLTCGGQNWLGFGEMGLCGLLVTKDSQYAITNLIEASRMRDEEHLEAMGFPIHAAVWYESKFEAETIEKLVPSGKVGADHPHPSGTNIAGEVQLLRFSLTEAEVERYKELGFMVSRALEETIAEIHPGDTEFKTISRLITRSREAGMDVVLATCAGDDRISNHRHPIATENKIQKRVQLSSNMRWKGIIVCATRNRSFVPLPVELKEQYRKNVEIDCTIMASSIPGNTFVSALEAGKAAYEARGYAEDFKKHHQGGPIGYMIREFRVDFDTPGNIHENQAFCWNPSLTGTKSEDTIIATSNGVVPVSRAVICPTMTLEVNGQTFVRPDIWETY